MCHFSPASLRPDTALPFWTFDYMRQHILLLMYKLVEFGFLSLSTKRFNEYRMTLKGILIYKNSSNGAKK